MQVVARSRRERMVAHDFAKKIVFGSRMNNLQVVHRGKCADHGRLAWTKCCSSRRSPDESMFHDGNFDQSVSSRVFFVGWIMHHASALSQIDQNPVGLRNPQTSSQLSVMDPGPHNGGGARWRR